MYFFPPPFSKTVYCSVGVSVVQKVERKKKDLILVYLSAASDFSEMRNHPRASVFRSVIWALLKACPRSGSPRSVLSGNALGDHARGSGPSKECRLGGWVPLETREVAGGAFMTLSLPSDNVLSDLEFHIFPLFLQMLNLCGWLFKRWLGKMQIYWAFTCQRRKFLGSPRGGPDAWFCFVLFFFSPILSTVEDTQWLPAVLREEKYPSLPFLLYLSLLSGFPICWIRSEVSSFWTSWAPETQLAGVTSWDTEQSLRRQRDRGTNWIWGPTGQELANLLGLREDQASQVPQW